MRSLVSLIIIGLSTGLLTSCAGSKAATRDTSDGLAVVASTVATPATEAVAPVNLVDGAGEAEKPALPAGHPKVENASLPAGHPKVENTPLPSGHPQLPSGSFP